jgi:predicted transcriptional regulator
MFYRGMKGVKVELDIYKDIRQSYIDGESQRHIAKRLGIARQTVKKYCEGAAHPDERKAYERLPDTITEDVKQFVLDCFKSDKEEHLKKQKHTARRIYDRLVEDMNFTGAESTIRTQ